MGEFFYKDEAGGRKCEFCGSRFCGDEWICDLAAEEKALDRLIAKRKQVGNV